VTGANGARANANGDNRWDLAQAAEAAAKEAGEVPFVFQYKGKTYTVPPTNKWPARAIDHLAEGDLGPALSEMLGHDAYRGMVEAGLNLGEINTLFERVSAETGFGSLPNSPPPPKRRATQR
jgi:hypothetical protein